MFRKCPRSEEGRPCDVRDLSVRTQLAGFLQYSRKRLSPEEGRPRDVRDLSVRTQLAGFLQYSRKRLSPEEGRPRDVRDLSVRTQWFVMRKPLERGSGLWTTGRAHAIRLLVI
ncbi:hypothetical protein NDU88_006406 [Pleurodeles waltl]|uniref:Uncharacterized protein n=1 Tax=Pleurodeles waltl TaxID=8319 RepID=A0AAV7LP14_PLEWA|nr:hypothetical protein NDU88_006406 [Pleurodeles waltl]